MHTYSIANSCIVLPQHRTVVCHPLPHPISFLAPVLAAAELADDRISVRSWPLGVTVPAQTVMFTAHPVHDELLLLMVLPLISDNARLYAAHMIRLAVADIQMTVFFAVSLIAVVTHKA